MKRKLVSLLIYSLIVGLIGLVIPKAPTTAAPQPRSMMLTVTTREGGPDQVLKEAGGLIISYHRQGWEFVSISSLCSGGSSIPCTTLIIFKRAS